MWDFGQKIPGARRPCCSITWPVKKAEIDNINGAIPREGGKLGIATPVNSVVVALLKAKETGFGNNLGSCRRKCRAAALMARLRPIETLRTSRGNANAWHFDTPHLASPYGEKRTSMNACMS